MKPILVTGAKGRVGSCLVPFEGRCYTESMAYRIEAIEGDITDASFRNEVVGRNPVAIINLAACTLPRAETEREEAERVNHVAVATMAKLGVPIVHISTDCVFNGKRDDPYTEEHQPMPVNHYGASKLAGELALEAAGGHIVIRTTGVFLSGRPNFLETVLSKARKGEDMEIVSDTLYTPTDARELAKAILIATERLIENTNVAGTYHFAGPESVSYADFAELVLAKANMEGLVYTPVAAADRERVEGIKRPKNACLNSDKFTATFGYRHRVLEQCVAETVAHSMAEAR